MAKPTNLQQRVRVLEDVEEIKKLKARYWRFMDRKLWSQLEKVFAKDSVLEYGDVCSQGSRAIVQSLKQFVGEVATAHGGHSPEIEITSDTTANGVWALHDHLVWKSGRQLVGFGHYEDQYVKQRGKWKIKATKITRLFEEWTMTKPYKASVKSWSL